MARFTHYSKPFTLQTMIIYLRGNDDFRSEEALHEIVAGFRSKYDPTGVSVVRLDGEKVTAEELQRALSAPGLLSSRQLVVLRRLAKRKATDVADQLAEVIDQKRIPATTIVVIWESGVPGSGKKKIHPLWKMLSALPARQPKSVGQDYQVLFEPSTGRQLESWLDQRAAHQKVRFTPASRALLIRLTLGNMRSLASELDKLANFKPGQTLDEAAVRKLVHAQLEPNIFDLTDALGTRNLPRALALLEEQLSAGAAPLYLITMFERQFRILVQLASAADEPPMTIARRLGLHPFVVQKSLEQARRFSLPILANLFEQIVSLDEHIKIGAVDANAGLTLFVVDACGSSS